LVNCAGDQANSATLSTDRDGTLPATMHTVAPANDGPPVRRPRVKRFGDLA
jgi:hypothetical protein